jgi:hypothetical protein
VFSQNIRAGKWPTRHNRVKIRANLSQISRDNLTCHPQHFRTTDEFILAKPLICKVCNPACQSDLPGKR